MCVAVLFLKNSRVEYYYVFEKNILFKKKIQHRGCLGSAAFLTSFVGDRMMVKWESFDGADG
jgi:hypothetical protein